MKVSECIDMFEGLKGLAGKSNVPGRMAYRVAKNLTLLKPIYDSLNDRKNSWLKENASVSDDGSYTLDGKVKESFVLYIQPILEEEETLPSGIRRLAEEDIPDGVEPAILVSLMDIIDEKVSECSDTTK